MCPSSHRSEDHLPSRDEQGKGERAVPERILPGPLAIPDTCRETDAFHYFPDGNNAQKYFFLSYQALVIDDPEILGQKSLLRPSLIIHVHHFDDY